VPSVPLALPPRRSESTLALRLFIIVFGGSIAVPVRASVRKPGKRNSRTWRKRQEVGEGLLVNLPYDPKLFRFRESQRLAVAYLATPKRVRSAPLVVLDDQIPGRAQSIRQIDLLLPSQTSTQAQPELHNIRRRGIGLDVVLNRIGVRCEKHSGTA